MVLLWCFIQSKKETDLITHDLDRHHYSFSYFAHNLNEKKEKKNLPKFYVKGQSLKSNKGSRNG